MRILPMVVLFLGTSLLFAQGGDPLKEPELKTFLGKWKLVAAEENGVILPKEKLPSISFVVHPNGKATVQAPDGEFQTSSTIDPTKQPKTIDMHFLSGVWAGQKQYGIYKVEGKRWTVFATRPGGEAKDRPRDFNTKGTPGRLMVWERVPEAKNP